MKVLSLCLRIFRRNLVFLSLVFLSLLALLLGDKIALVHPAQAQQLDSRPSSTWASKSFGSRSKRVERYVPTKAAKPTQALPSPSSSPASSVNPPDSMPAMSTMSAPLTATVTKTLYLPPAMYGQWNVAGTLLKTNAPDAFSPSVNDIWQLDREGDKVTVTNPANGAYATINVDMVDGEQATFHRSGTVGKHGIYQEIPTITVQGDTFSGQSLNKVQEIKNGQVVSEIYGLYRLEATRISAGRTRFHPENDQQAPDLEIEEIHAQKSK